MTQTITSGNKIFFKKEDNKWISTIFLQEIKKDDIFKYTPHGQTFSFQDLDQWKALTDAKSADVRGKTVGVFQIEAERV